MQEGDAARILAALGHEGRLQIFRLLVQAGPEGLPAGEIARRIGQLQNTTSGNLGVLFDVGLVSTRRDGRSVIYAAHHERFSACLEFVTANFFDDRSGDRAAFFQGLLDACSAGGPYEDRELHRDRGDDAA